MQPSAADQGSTHGGMVSHLPAGVMPEPEAQGAERLSDEPAGIVKHAVVLPAILLPEPHSPLEPENIPPKAESCEEFSEPPGELQRFDVPDSLQLETRGITSQKPDRIFKAKSPQSQPEFWRSATVFKNSVAAKLRQAGETERADLLERCHTEFTIAECQSCGKAKAFPNRCDRFYCPECQPRLAWDRQRGIEWWCLEVSQPKHVVLTVRNIADLTAGHVLELKKWWQRLRRRKFARSWQGGLYNIEVTNEKRGWHLHLHALVDARFIDEAQLSREWAKVTSKLGYIVKVKDARGKKYLHEVAKYVVKPAQIAKWTPAQIVTFIHAFEGVRTFGVFGSLYGKRTEYSEWIAQIRDCKPTCKCGSCDIRYYTESEWETQPRREPPSAKPRPPNAKQPFLSETLCETERWHH